MGRFSSGGSSSHRVRVVSAAHGDFELSWTVDRYYHGSRLRFPKRCRRDTDRDGALRFIERWRIPLGRLDPATREALGLPCQEGN